MAKKRTTSAAAPSSLVSGHHGALTAERIVRLYRLLRLLDRPQTRGALTRRLRIDVRGFYRDLDSLRSAGVKVILGDGRYSLGEALDTALSQLPFPDPQLTLAEARALAKGRTAVHRRLRKQIERLLK